MAAVDFSPWPTRRTLVAIAAVQAAFAVYLSLIPFGLQRIALSDAVRRFGQVVGQHEAAGSPADFAANLTYFLLLGFWLTGSLVLDRGRVGSRVLGAAVAVGTVCCLVFGLEFAELYVPNRVPSESDIRAGCWGAASGAALWLVTGQRVAEWFRAGSRDPAPTMRVVRAAVVYAIGFVIVGFAPFDFTADPSTIAKKWRDGQIALVPFQGQHSSATVVWNGLWTVLAAVPIGILSALAGRRGRAPSRGSAILSGTAALAALEVAQVFVRSATSSATSVIWGAVGVACGTGVAVLAARPQEGLRTSADPRVARLLGSAIVIVAAGAAMAYHWHPFRFSGGVGAFQARMAGLSLVPFVGYYHSAPALAFRQFVIKVGIGAALGATVELRRHLRRSAPWTTAALVRNAVAALAFFGLIEAGQVLLPSRTPDTGDALLGAVGAMVGMLIAAR